MNINCTNCNSEFTLEKEQVSLFEESKSKGMTFLMLHCPNCNSNFFVNPQTNSTEQEKEIETTWRSPISGSLGYVSFIEDDERSFYGCSETGAIWYEKENFFNSITEIINRYPHRKLFYIKENDAWVPNYNEPKNAKDLINSEETEYLDDFVLG